MEGGISHITQGASQTPAGCPAIQLSSDTVFSKTATDSTGYRLRTPSFWVFMEPPSYSVQFSRSVMSDSL